MPGYRALDPSKAGVAAEHVREAESRHRAGDLESAARLLEEALSASLAVRTEIPGWLCGRLAAIYRTLRRYDDEVRLLERYRESQSSQEARTRYDARLFKARTIADRKRRPECGALASVRASLERPRSRRKPVADPPRAEASSRFSDCALAELRAALADDADVDELRLRTALQRLSTEAAVSDAHAEQLVETLKAARDHPERDPRVAAARRERYSRALVLLLALHFEDTVS